MSYINRKTKVFLEGPPIRVVPVRSEARLKRYLSSTDARAWSDAVEERRQHILEYAAKNKEGTCFDKDFPLEALFDAMMACKNCKIRKLIKKINYYEKLMRLYSQLDLTADQQKKIKDLHSGLQKAYDALGVIDCDKEMAQGMFGAGGSGAGGYGSRGTTDDEKARAGFSSDDPSGKRDGGKGGKPGQYGDDDPEGGGAGKRGDRSGEAGGYGKDGAARGQGMDDKGKTGGGKGGAGGLEDELDGGGAGGSGGAGGPGGRGGPGGPGGVGGLGADGGVISAENKCQARCAMIVRQVQERNSVQAVASGGVVTLPEKQSSLEETIIPQGYLPGETLPEIMKCKAACAMLTDVPKEADEQDLTETSAPEVVLAVVPEAPIGGTISRVLSGEALAVGISPSITITVPDQTVPKILSAEILQKPISEIRPPVEVKLDTADANINTEIKTTEQAIETVVEEYVIQETQTPVVLESAPEVEVRRTPVQEEVIVVTDQYRPTKTIVEEPIIIIEDATANEVIEESEIPRAVNLDESAELEDLPEIESHVTQMSDESVKDESILTPICDMPCQQLEEDYVPRAASLENNAILVTPINKLLQSELTTTNQILETEIPQTTSQGVCPATVDLKSTGVCVRHICSKPVAVQVVTEPIYYQPPAPPPVQIIITSVTTATTATTTVSTTAQPPPSDGKSKVEATQRDLRDTGVSPRQLVTFDQSTESRPEKKGVCTCKLKKIDEATGKGVCTCKKKGLTDEGAVKKICKAICSSVLPSHPEQEQKVEGSEKKVCICSKSKKKTDESVQETVVSQICKAVCATILPSSSGEEDNKVSDLGKKVCECQLKKNVCQGICAKSVEDDLPVSVADKDAEIISLRRAMVAKEAYCAEQRKIAAAAIEQLENIKNIVEERDDLRRKLENSQYELDDLKRNIALGKPYIVGDADRGEGKLKKAQSKSGIHVPLIGNKPTEQNSCEEEISALEEEINKLRSGKLTPDLEAQVIRKEVEVLKKYCAKLSNIQAENCQLKYKLAEYEDKFKFLGYEADSGEKFEDLKEKLEHLNETIKERDMLKARVEKLERELYNYKDLPEDIEAFKQRSMLLDEVLKDRDRLSKRAEEVRGIEQEVKNLRKKSAKVDELDEQLKRLSREKSSIESELEAMKCRCSAAEIEALNQRAEGDSLRSKLVCMEHELESLSCISKDNIRLKSERSNLQKSMDDLMRTQGDYEHVCNQLKCLDVLKSERDMYKSKYESLVGLECECDILRAQVDRAKCIEKERDALETQVEDLEYCIAEQEDEIRRLVCHIDTLAQGRDEQQNKLKGVLTTMRAEIEKKECIIASSEEKLACVQDQLKNSIEGLSCETANLRNRNEKLEKEVCDLKRCNVMLRNQLTNEETMKDNLQKTITECQRDLNRTECVTDAKTCKSMKDSSNETDDSGEKQCETELEKEICRLRGRNNILQAQLSEKENEITNLKKTVREAVPQGSKRPDGSSEESIGCECNILKIELEAAKSENKRLQETLNKMGSMTNSDQHVQEIIRQSKCALQVITQELGKQYEEWDCIKKRMSQQTGRPTQDHGMGTEDSRKWDCKKKGMGRTENDDGTQWDCKKGGAPSDGRDWDCKKEGGTGSRPSMQSKPSSQVQCTCDKDCNCKDDQNAPSTSKPDAADTTEYYPNIDDWDCVKRKKGGKTDGATQCACENIDGETQCDCQKNDADVQCGAGLDKIGELERDLTQSNEAILKLKERLSATERLSAENSALRRHSSEVQEVAKDQIEELVEHLKKAKEMVANLEEENNKLNSELSDLRSEKEKLLGMVKELNNSCGDLTSQLEKKTESCQRSVDRIKELDGRVSQEAGELENLLKECENQKDELGRLKAELDKEKSNCTNTMSENENLKSQLQDMEKMLTTNVVTTSRRSSKLEENVDSLRKQNDDLKEENASLKDSIECGNKGLLNKIDSLTNENSELRNQIDAITRELEEVKTGPGGDALQKENENLLKQMEQQKRDMAKMLDKLNQPLPTSVCRLNKGQMEKDQKEKDALQSIINDLENQLRSSGQKSKPICPTVELKTTIDDLTKRLEEEQSRADAAEEALKKFKASDPSLMLNDEITNLRQRISDLENENNRLSQMAGDSNEIAKLKQELQSALNDLNELSNENGELRQALMNLQSENNGLIQNLEALQADSQLKDEYEKMKNGAAQLENDKALLKHDLDQMANEMQKVYDKVAELQDENGELKQRLVKLENENSKLRKDLDAAFTDMQKNMDKVCQLEQENARYRQQINKLEGESAGLKDDLGSSLNEAKRGCSGVSDLQKQLALLKQQVAELEAENGTLKKDLKAAVGSAKSGCLGAAQLRDENGKLKLTIADLEAQIEELKQQLGGLADSADMQNELSDLRDKLARLEAENAQLKKDLSAAEEEVKKGAQLLDEIAKLKQQLVELDNDNAKMKKDLEKAIAEASGVDQQKDEANRLRDLLAQLQAENAKLKGDLNSALDDLKKAQETVAQLQDNESKMKQRLDTLEAENSKMKTDLQQALDEARKTAAALEQLRDDESKLKQRLAQLETDNSKLKQDLDDSRAAAAELEKLKDENSKLKQNISSMQDENSKLKKDLDDSKSADGEAKLKQQVSLLEGENSKLKKELEGLRDEHKNCAKIISQLKEEIDALKSKLASLEKENADLRRDYEGAMGDAKRSAAELAKLKDGEAKLREQLLKLQGENDKLNKDVIALNAEIQNNSGGLGQLKDSEAKLKQRIAQLESENAKLKKDLDAALEDAKKAAQLKDEDSKSKQRIAQLEAELAKLKKEMEAAGGPKTGAGDEDLKQRLAQLEAENKRLKSDLEKAENEAKKSNADLSKLRDDDGKMKQLLAQLENENAKLKKDLEKALADAQSGSTGASQLKDENNKLKQRISQLESEIAKLKKDLDAALDDAKNSASGLSKMQADDARLKQLIDQLERDNAKLKADLEAAQKEAQSGSGTASQLKDENAKQKQRIAQLESEIANLKKLQEENAKLKQKVSDLELQLSQMQSSMSKMKGDLDAALVQAEKGNLVDDYEAQLKKLQAELERQKKECNDSLASLKEQFEKDRKKLLKDNEDLKNSYEAKIKALNDKHDSALKKAQAELDCVKSERDKLKGVLEDQRRKSLDIKDKVEKVESVVSKERRKSKDLEEEVKSLKNELSLKEKSADNLTTETFETVTIIGVFPEVIAITAPLSDKELKFFGSHTCPCDSSFEAVVTKFASKGIESLSIEELQLLHAKICDATANVLEKIGKSTGVLKPNEGNKLALMRRVAELEGDLMKKQKHAQQKVTAMQYAVNMEKERLIELRKNLEEEKRKNNMLQNQIGSQSKVVSNIQEERDLIQRQQSYHEVKLEHYIVKIEEERAKYRNLEDELDKERTNVMHLKQLLDVERDRAKLSRRRDSEAIESMKIKLEKTLTSEMMLKMKLQGKHRSHSPCCAPVRDTSYPSRSGSKTYHQDSSSGSKPRHCCTRHYTGLRKSSSTSSNGLDLGDRK